MSRAAKLGEDITRGNEALITERAYAAIASRNDLCFERQDHNDLPFPYYQVIDSE
jgi:hypothetical protein